MNDQKATLVINAIVDKSKMAEVQSYLEKIMPVFAKNGGQPIAKYKTVEQISGDQSPEMISIVEFPNSEVIKEMVSSTDFTELSDLRSSAFSKLNLMICASM